MDKKKILWVVYNFNQAGAQRYVYEICKALDKEKVTIDFLKVAPMNHDKDYQNEFYYEPSLALAGNIFFVDDIFENTILGIITFTQRIRIFILRKLGLDKVIYRKQQKERVGNEKRIERFFAKYDCVNFSGTNVFRTICIANNLHPDNGIIHILAARFQDNKLYDGYNKSLHYNFVCPIIKENVPYELEGFTDYNYTLFPMCFEAVPFEINTKLEMQPFVIAVFTRLSYMKPLDPYFYGLKLLIEQGVNVELHVYGAGDPAESGFTRQLNYLYIADKVKFLGHADSIPCTLKSANIDVVWYQSGNKQPAGYAAFEIAMSGLPQVFWDFMDMGQTHTIEEVFKSFTDLTSFVNYNRQLLQSAQIRLETGTKQREYVLNNYSINKNIHTLVELFDKCSPKL